MGYDESTITKIPTIDFSGLELSKPGTEAWDATRAKVMEALDTVSFFTVVFDGVSGELIDELFSSVGDTLFSPPLELKMKLASDKPYQGYIPVVAGFSYESLNIHYPQRLDSVRAFTDHLFPPQGNPKICDALWTYCKKSYELELIVKRMILEGLGIAEHFIAFMESTLHEFRISKYGLPDNDTMVALNTHKDMNLTNILYQHEFQGLEVLTKSGDWLYLPPKTFTITTGESFEAWSNGRIKAVPHRVRMLGNGTRYSLGFASQFKDGFMIEAPKELVSEEHPKLFEPFEFISYMFFCSSEEGAKAKDTLKAFCGSVNNGGDQIQA